MSNEQFGTSIAALGDRILVGCHLDNSQLPSITGDGAVYVYDSSGNLLHTISNPLPGPQTYDYFGFSVAVVGGNILVSAYQDDLGAPTGLKNYGAAYLFDGTTYALLATMNNPTPPATVPPHENFGYAVAALGNNILIGTPYDKDNSLGIAGSGAVYLYEGPVLGPEPTAVPEPSALALVAMGLLGIRRRRK